MEINRNDNNDNSFYEIRSNAYAREYNEVIYKLNAIKELTDSIYEILDKHFSHDSKNFSVTYSGVQYEFFYPSTKKEFKKLNKMRKKFIKNILCDVVTKSIKWPKKANDLHNFLALMLLGEDPKDHQMEQIIEEEKIVFQEEAEKAMNVGVNQSGRKAIPLDLDNHFVKSALNDVPSDIISFEDMRDEWNRGEERRNKIKEEINA